MTMMSDLSHDMLEAILSRVQRSSLRAVRLTCKQWNRFSKHRILCKPEARQDQVLGFTVMDDRLYSMRFNLHGLGLNGEEEDSEEFVDPEIKPIGNILNVLDVSQVCYCNGLLLCVTSNYLKELVVWNPYLEKFRSIQPRNGYRVDAKYAFGYDQNKNYKILRFLDGRDYCEDYYEIYDLKSNSCGLYGDIPNWDRYIYKRGASLNGNTYFMSGERQEKYPYCGFIICFDFTTERFGQIIPLPFTYTSPYSDEFWTLSSVREEKLAVLHQFWENTSVIEIWLTDKIEPNAASWSKFLRVDMTPPFDFDDIDGVNDSFFIDEEKKVAVVFSSSGESKTSTAYIIGDNRYLKTVDLDRVANSQKCLVGQRQYGYVPVLCSPSYYVPSLVRINKITGCERKENKWKDVFTIL